MRLLSALLLPEPLLHIGSVELGRLGYTFGALVPVHGFATQRLGAVCAHLFFAVSSPTSRLSLWILHKDAKKKKRAACLCVERVLYCA